MPYQDKSIIEIAAILFHYFALLLLIQKLLLPFLVCLFL